MYREQLKALSTLGMYQLVTGTRAAADMPLSRIAATLSGDEIGRVIKDMLGVPNTNKHVPVELLSWYLPDRVTLGIEPAMYGANLVVNDRRIGWNRHIVCHLPSENPREAEIMCLFMATAITSLG